MRLQQFAEIVGKDLGRESDGDALGPKHQQHGDFARKTYRFLVAPIIAGDKFGQLIVEELRACQRGQATFDVPRGCRGISGEEIAKVTLAFNEVLLVGEDDQCIADGSISMRVVLHAVAHNVGHLDEFAIVVLMQ